MHSYEFDSYVQLYMCMYILYTYAHINETVESFVLTFCSRLIKFWTSIKHGQETVFCMFLSGVFRFVWSLDDDLVVFYVSTEELVELLRLADVTSLVKTLQMHDESQVSRLAKQAYTSIK